MRRFPPRGCIRFLRRGTKAGAHGYSLSTRKFTLHKYLLWLLTLGGIFLSIWIVLPAPIYALLPLSIGAPELSPGILCLNVVTLILSGIDLQRRTPRKRRTALASLGSIVLAVGLSASPLLQFAQVQQQAEQAMVDSLGRDYQHDLARSIETNMRSKPLILADLWRGIPQPQVRIERNIPFCPSSWS